MATKAAGRYRGGGGGDTSVLCLSRAETTTFNSRPRTIGISYVQKGKKNITDFFHLLIFFPLLKMEKVVF